MMIAQKFYKSFKMTSGKIGREVNQAVDYLTEQSKAVSKVLLKALIDTKHEVWPSFRALPLCLDVINVSQWVFGDNRCPNRCP